MSYEQALAAARSELVREITREVRAEVAAAIRAELGTGALTSGRRWLNTKEAADYLGIDEDTLGAAARRGEVRCEQDKPGSKRWFEPDALDEWRRAGGRKAA